LSIVDVTTVPLTHNYSTTIKNCY